MGMRSSVRNTGVMYAGPEMVSTSRIERTGVFWKHKDDNMLMIGHIISMLSWINMIKNQLLPDWMKTQSVFTSTRDSIEARFIPRHMK